MVKIFSGASVLLLGAVLAILAGCDGIKERPVMRIGYMNCNSESETIARFTPLTAYLSEQLGIDFKVVPVDTQDFAERFSAGDFEFGHSNSLLYIILKETKQMQLIATDKRGQYGARTAGTIISRKGSGITRVEDLKGKRMVFGPQLAPSGYLAQYDLMLQAGFDPETGLEYYAIPHGSYKHEKVIYGVYFGQYDAAAAPALDLELMTREGRVTADDFNIVAQSEVFPYCTFGAASSVPKSLVEKFRQVLLNITPQTTVDYDGEKIKVLDSAWVSGFEHLADNEYDILRRMAKNANMPPYQEF